MAASASVVYGVRFTLTPENEAAAKLHGSGIVRHLDADMRAKNAYILIELSAVSAWSDGNAIPVPVGLGKTDAWDVTLREDMKNLGLSDAGICLGWWLKASR